MKKTKLRIAATGDLHYGRHSKGKCQDLFVEASSSSDVLLICGDLTDFGLSDEARILADDLKNHLGIPCIAVVGNHDFESGHIVEIEKILEDAGVQILDGESCEFQGVGLAGTCGFCGGFGPRMLSAWGEPIVKSFVQEALDHALRLEKSLARLQTDKKIVMLHYAPIVETVVGENPEIFPFLGSSRLEGSINRFSADLVIHGHAHAGSLLGKTSTGIPVHNVALPLRERAAPNESRLLLFEI